MCFSNVKSRCPSPSSQPRRRQAAGYDHQARQDPRGPRASQEAPEQQDPSAQQALSAPQERSAQEDLPAGAAGPVGATGPPERSEPLARLVLLEQSEQQALCQRAKSRNSCKITRWLEAAP